MRNGWIQICQPLRSPERLTSTDGPGEASDGTAVIYQCRASSCIEWRGQKVHTAIWKQPAPGRIAARRLNLEGDGQGDLAGHGGEHRAVMVYQMDAYRYWEIQLGRSDFSFGQFGGNFHSSRVSRRQGLHRRSIPHWKRALRGHSAARHMLSRGYPGGTIETQNGQIRSLKERLARLEAAFASAPNCHRRPIAGVRRCGPNIASTHRPEVTLTTNKITNVA